MPSNAEIAKDTIEQFKKIQRYMAVAKKEEAKETYAVLKEEYLALKALLNVIGVNLIDIDTIKEQQKQKAGDRMPSNAEIAKDTFEQFKKIQDYMILAKEENAVKTYDRLKREYLSLKALLNVIGVNLIDIDTVKE